MKYTKVADGIYTHLSPAQVKRVKAAAKFAGLDYRAIVARPSTAIDFCERVEKAMNIRESE
jgi:hypothetical protein